MDKYERFRRVQSVWSWLPAFRAAAESESLREASQILGVSRPAISRTIRLVEEELGVGIFDRSGRSLELTEEGKILLDGVRDAMRRVDDQLDKLFGKMPTHLHLALTPSLGSSLGRIHELVDRSEFEITLNVSIQEAPLATLRQGQVDLILMFEELIDDDRSTESVSLGSIEWRLCALETHVAFAEESPSVRGLLERYPHVALSDEVRLNSGPIPAYRQHPQALVSSATLLEEFARRLDALAVFPATHPIPEGFRTFDVEMRSTPVVAIRRSRLKDEDLVDELIGLIDLGQ